MKNLMLFAVVFLLLFSCDSGVKKPVPSDQQKQNEINADAQYKSELEEIRKTIRGETKIKVKKDTKGYSWEITGKDPQEILKANEALRKRLGE